MNPTPTELRDAFSALEKGQSMVYWTAEPNRTLAEMTGHMIDVGGGVRHQSSLGRMADAVREWAWDRYMSGQADLLQRKNDDGTLEYIIVKRHKRADVLDVWSDNGPIHLSERKHKNDPRPTVFQRPAAGSYGRVVVPG